MKSSKRQLRKFWLNVHLFTALIFGLLFVIIGVTGSVNVFYKELEGLGIREIKTDKSVSANYHSLDQVFQKLIKKYPRRSDDEIWLLVMPQNVTDGMATWQYCPDDFWSETCRMRMLLVNPFSAEIMNDQYVHASIEDSLVLWIYRLHSSLLLAELGADIVGIIALFLILSLSTGLYLWWPRAGKLKPAFSIKRNASRQRLTFDIHRVGGIYFGGVLFILAFTGFYIIYPQFVKPLVKVFSTLPEEPELVSILSPNAQRISLSDAVAIADTVFPQTELRSISIPEKLQGVIEVSKRQQGEANRIYSASTVSIDQYSEKILNIKDPNKFTAGETFLNLMWPLHTGEALGLPGRILVCVTGLVPPILYITGIIRWLQKRKAKNSRKIKHSKIKIP